MQCLHHSHYIIENNDGLSLAQSLFFDDIMLQVDEVGRLVAEVVGTEAVEHQTDSSLHLPHFVGLHVLDNLTGAVLRRRSERDNALEKFCAENNCREGIKDLTSYNPAVHLTMSNKANDHIAAPLSFWMERKKKIRGLKNKMKLMD